MDISNILIARSTEEPFYDSPVEEEPMISKGSSSKPNGGKNLLRWEHGSIQNS